MKTAYVVMPCITFLETNLLISLGFKAVSSPKDADVILFTGGMRDIHPAYYNQEITGADCGNFPQERTEEELQIYNSYKNTKKFLGICRGLQFLNIVHGGTLIQHINGHSGGYGGYHSLYDPVTLLELGSVNSSHHQCIGESTGTPLAISKDSVVEAMVWENSLGVQWHPEYSQEGEFSFDYFKTLVEKHL